MHIQIEQPYIVYNVTTLDAYVRDILLELHVQHRYCSDVNSKNDTSNTTEISQI